MSETKDPDEQSAKAGRKTMTLSVKRTVESGMVRQNFSHGRSKSVVVEKKRTKRPLSMQDAVAAVPQEQPAKPAPAPAAPTAPKPAQGAQQRGRRQDAQSSDRQQQS